MNFRRITLRFRIRLMSPDRTMSFYNMISFNWHTTFKKLYFKLSSMDLATTTCSLYILSKKSAGLDAGRFWRMSPVSRVSLISYTYRAQQTTWSSSKQANHNTLKFVADGYTHSFWVYFLICLHLAPYLAACRRLFNWGVSFRPTLFAV